MGKNRLSPWAFRVLWVIDLGALLILMLPYTFGASYCYEAGGVVNAVLPSRLLVGWILASTPLIVITWRRRKR